MIHMFILERHTHCVYFPQWTHLNIQKTPDSGTSAKYKFIDTNYAARELNILLIIVVLPCSDCFQCTNSEAE